MTPARVHDPKEVTDRASIGVYVPAGHLYAPSKQQDRPKGPAHGTCD